MYYIYAIHFIRAPACLLDAGRGVSPLSSETQRSETERNRAANLTRGIIRADWGSVLIELLLLSRSFARCDTNTPENHYQKRCLPSSGNKQ